MARLEYSREKGLRANDFRIIEDIYRARKYQKAQEMLNEFLKKYPDDDIGWHYQARLYMQENRFNDALTILDITEPNVMMQIDKVKCYIELERYEEAYTLASYLRGFVQNEKSRTFLKRAIIYSLSQLKRYDEIEISRIGYVEKQMLSYDREIAIRYSKSQQSDNHLFKREISIDNVFLELEQRLDSSNKLPNTMTLTDTYLFNIKGIGNSSGRDLDIIKAITIHNREDIISVYPATKIKNYPKENIQDANDIKSKILKR